MKKLLGMFLSIALMFSLIGCSNSEKSTKSGKPEVTMWVHVSDENEEGKVYQELVDGFNKKFGDEVKANIEFIPRSGSGGGYEDKINAALTTNTLPDVITLDGPNTAAYAKSGVIAPLDEYIKDKKDLLPSILQQGTYDKKLYAIGVSESSVGVFYNKKMFQDAGIDLATLPTVEQPWDWNQFMDLSKKLSEKYNVPAVDMMLNSKDEWLTYAFAPFVWSAGGDIISEDGKAKGVFNSKETEEAMQFLQTMIKDGYTTISPVKQAFETGKYPMKFSGVWTITDIQTNFKDLDYGIMPYPVSPTNKELVSPSGSWEFAMTKTSKNQKWAAKLVEWMTSTDANVTLARKIAALPTRYSSEEILTKEFSDEMNVLVQQLKVSGHARPVTPAYPQITRSFQKTIEDISFYNENKDNKKVLNSRAVEMQTALDKVR